MINAQINKNGEVRRAIQRNCLNEEGENYSLAYISYVYIERRHNIKITAYLKLMKKITDRYERKIATMVKKIDALKANYLKELDNAML